MTSLDLNTPSWLEHFNKTTQIEREVIQFLAILMESIHATNLTRILQATPIRGEKNLPLTNNELKTILAKLYRLGLLEQEDASLNQFRCATPLLTFATHLAIQEGRFQELARVIQTELPAIRVYYTQAKKLHSFTRGIREIRLALFDHNLKQMEFYITLCQNQFPKETKLNPLLTTACGYPFDINWFQTLPLTIQAMVLEEMVPYLLSQFENVTSLLPLLHLYHKQCSDSIIAGRFRYLLVMTLIFQGQIALAQKILDGELSIMHHSSLQGWIYFLLGKNDMALEAFETAFLELKRSTRKRKIFFPDLGGLFFLLALLKTGDPGQYHRLEEFLILIRDLKLQNTIPSLRFMDAVFLAQNNETRKAIILLETGLLMDAVSLNNGDLKRLTSKNETLFTKLFQVMARIWIDQEYARAKPYELEVIFNQAKKNGYQWAAMEAASLLALLQPKNSAAAEFAATVQANTGLQSMMTIVAKEERWERALKALISIGGDGSGKSSHQPTSATQTRLIWMLQLLGHQVSIQPLLQTNTHGKGWTKGRPVALNRLYEETQHLDFLSDHDRKICATIVQETPAFGGTFYSFSKDRLLLALVGHPMLFWEDQPELNLEVVQAEPELLVNRSKGVVLMNFSEKIEHLGVIFRKVSPTRCKVIEITPAHKRIADILGEKGLEIPAQEQQRVLEAMHSLASLVTVQSHIGGGVENLTEVPADSRPHLSLSPLGDGLKINLLVRPFTDEGPTFLPGQGGQTILAEIKGQRVQTHRQLDEEKKRLQQLLTLCPQLVGSEREPGQWQLDDPDHCLELLLQLQTLNDQVVVEWPEGEKMRVRPPITMDKLRIQVKRDQNWFALTGQLHIDETLILEMGELLELLHKKESRFIPIGNHEFITLTEAFRKRLLDMEAFSEKSAQGQRFHPLAGPLLRELSQEAGAFRSDNHWKAHLKRVDQAQTLDPPLPSTLQTELRDYQQVGYRWLSRLAAWGVGACLADDMGLGKTVQTMALLLSRAQQGPSLVIAPTSVCMNWQTEILRFAPTLNGILFGGTQRTQILQELRPFDLMICSYGLLQQEADLFATINWNVLVVDEAQAIKNRLTKRSKAVMNLKAAFKMVTTGTPIENHLGEFWNLFQFINPGLLGTLERFNERFAASIERDPHSEARHRLKKLIQPFILRRTKSQVLDELPPRTEITLQVEMSPEETAFYESIRRQAIEEIENFQGPMAHNHLQILAQIMRLRRACCNSRLVLPDSPIISSKLLLFWEVVENLLENRHKVLVFSQFVDHLTIVRQLLDQKKVFYQFLDGSTPAKERKKRVEAFQSGEGDLFLISLKAGGLGINLTAADYVIHMDPWWNPAVEDQASDRAHRIGQQRPVTIYRLVTKNSIEEKIVDLHKHKRDLADGLLEGGEISGKLSATELLKMIQGNL
ncbi:MAG: DEAD/DEAH box helicase [Magnetococcus sp. DMHC-6]